MKISNPPESSALMATARSFGNYDLSAALADLIDNSIKAQSTTIDIEFQPGESDVAVFIRDNGYGMDGEALIRAMKPASTHPEDQRGEDDLGRFGWGRRVLGCRCCTSSSCSRSSSNFYYASIQKYFCCWYKDRYFSSCCRSCICCSLIFQWSCR